MLKDASVLLDKMTGFEFEELVADILKRLGYGHIEKILYTQDEGRDIIIHSPDGLIIVECKHHPKGSIGRPIVQKLHSAVITSKAIKGILVTTGHFTKEALEYSRKLSSSSAPIEMVDRTILADMASRAKINLVSGKQRLGVWTYVVPTITETLPVVGSHIASLALSYPRHPSELLSNLKRNISYRPVYDISYTINSVFRTSIGVIHQEKVSGARLIMDGNNGQIYENTISEFFLNEIQAPFSQPHEDFIGVLPTFQVDSTTMHNRAKKTIINLHTRTVSYHGNNNHRYTKTCIPGERDVYISNIRQFYLPLTRMSFKLGTEAYSIEGAQAPSGRLLSITDNLQQCKICNDTIDEGAILYDNCGKITHSGKLLIRNIHGFKCKHCGRTTCRNDGYWRRKHLLFKELICTSCMEKIDKSRFRKFEPYRRSFFHFI